MMSRRRWVTVLMLLVTAALTGQPGTVGLAQSDIRTFPETGYTLGGVFLRYWDTNGGLSQFGYPISNEMQETSATDGKTYTTQYFERAVFEHHPQNAGTPYEVLLSLLGSHRYLEHYGPSGAASQQASTTNPLYFPQTKRTIGGVFRTYWEQNGGLARQGYPISDEFEEISSLDGKRYRVQYFERAVFEWHPEKAGTPYEVLLTHLGTYVLRVRFRELHIPLPKNNRLLSGGPLGSETHVMWRELQRSPWGYSNVVGMSLHSRQLLTLTTDRDQWSSAMPAIVGPNVVWRGSDQDCNNCANSLIYKNLFTEESSIVVAGSEGKSVLNPVVTMTKLAWLMRDLQGDHIMLKDLSTGEQEEVELLPDGLWGVYNLGLTDSYLVYAAHEKDRSTHLRVKDLESGQIRTLGSENNQRNYPTVMGVAGHYALWGTSRLLLLNLKSGEAIELNKTGTNAIAMRGNTAIWAVPEQRGNWTDIWGMKLSEGRPLKLFRTAARTHLAIAGDWLVWTNSETDTGWLASKGLHDLFRDAQR